MFGPRWAWLGVGLLFLAGPSRVEAQNIGSGFDTVSAGRSFSANDVFDSEAKRSRFHLGPLLFFPQLGITGLGYSNGFGYTYASSGSETQPTERRKGDFTATAHAGVRALLPIGSRYRLAGDIAATYLWFARSVENRRLGVNSSVSALAELGRVQVNAGASLYNETIQLSSELPARTDQRSRGIHGGISVPIGDRLFVRGNVQLRSPEYRDSGSFGNEVSRLDRTEVGYALGLGYEMNTRLSFDASYQVTRGRYSNESARDVDGRGYVFGLRYGRDRLFSNAQVAYRRYEESKGVRSGLYGALSVGVRLGRAFDVSVTGSRGRTDSLFLDQTTFDELRGATALGYTFERLLNLRLAAGLEIGNNTYPSDVVVDGVSYRRRDDVVTYRLTAGVQIGKFANVGATLHSSRYTSNVPGYDRDVTEILVNLSLFTGGIQIIK